MGIIRVILCIPHYVHFQVKERLMQNAYKKINVFNKHPTTTSQSYVLMDECNFSFLPNMNYTLINTAH